MTHAAQIRHELALNAEGKAPEWVQLLPAGAFAGRDGRAWTNAHPVTILTAFNTHAGPLAIDYEHAGERDNGQPAPAAGWITALEDRGGEIWGKVEWTEPAANMIARREYRFLSPVFYFDEARNVVALKGAGLTNQPNLIMTALNKRVVKAPDYPPNPETVHMDKATRIALCKSLGLADEASDHAILEAVTKLQDDRNVALNKAETPDATKFVPRADYDQVTANLQIAQNRLSELDGKEAEAVVDQAIKDGKIAPASKDYHLAACKTEGGLDKFKSMVAASPKLVSGEPDKHQRPGDEAVALNKDQRKILEGLGVNPEDETIAKELRAAAG